MGTMSSKSKVTELTVARLYNLGDYEHIKYEVRVEVGNRKPGALLTKLETLLAGLNPKEPRSHVYANAVEWFALDQKSKEEAIRRCTDVKLCAGAVRERIAQRNTEFQVAIREHDAWVKRRELAKALLDKLV
jgi:hypothetical protein